MGSTPPQEDGGAAEQPSTNGSAPAAPGFSLSFSSGGSKKRTVGGGLVNVQPKEESRYFCSDTFDNMTFAAFYVGSGARLEQDVNRSGICLQERNGQWIQWRAAGIGRPCSTFAGWQTHDPQA